MKDENRGLSISERLIPSIGKNNKTNKSASMKDEEWEVIDRKPLGTIRLCLLASISFNISNKKTTTNLMKALAKLYEKPSSSNKVL